MLNPTHPTIDVLSRHGYKVTAHLFFRDGAVSLCATAHHPGTRRTFHGRSRHGDFEAAMMDLQQAAGIADRPSPP